MVDIDLTDPKVTQAAVLLQAGFRGLKTRSKFKSKVGFLHDSARLSHEMHNFTTVTFDKRQFCTNFSPCLPPFKSTTVQSMWYQQLSYLHDVFPLVSCMIFPSIQSLFWLPSCLHDFSYYSFHEICQQQNILPSKWFLKFFNYIWCRKPHFNYLFNVFLLLTIADMLFWNSPLCHMSKKSAQLSLKNKSQVIISWSCHVILYTR